MFDAPIFGPFVETNGLSGGFQTGAAISWTSGGQAYRLDVLRDSSSRVWREYPTFAQIPDLTFEKFLFLLFENTSGLPEFLNDMQRFFRPSSGAPTPAEAGKWLNPILVQSGFTLGMPKVRPEGVRIPVVWAFGENIAEYGARSVYSRVDFIDWRPDRTELLRRSDCWGTGAQALRRLLHQLVDSMNSALLTRAGNERMEEIYSRKARKTGPQGLKPERLSQMDKTIEPEAAKKLRRALPNIDNISPDELKLRISQLSEKSFLGLLRTCGRSGLEASVCTLLKYRSLPTLSREKLISEFIGLRWKEVWRECIKEAGPFFRVGRRRAYNHLLSSMLKSGDVQLITSILRELGELDLTTAQCLVNGVMYDASFELLDILFEVPSLGMHRDDCLLDAFELSLLRCFGDPSAPMLLLEKGARPIRALKCEEPIRLTHWLLQDRNLEVLKRAFDLEPPSADSLGCLFASGFIPSGASFEWLCSISRDFAGHKQRMAKVIFHSIVYFIRTGQKDCLVTLALAFEEGGLLSEVAFADFEREKLLTGYRWKEREGHWIDLIGYFAKRGLKEDVEFLKRFKRRPLTSTAKTRSVA